MSSSFDNKKSLRFTITLGQKGATFDDSSSANQITLEGFRATVSIDKAGGVQMNSLNARIYGVSQKHINQLTSLAYQPQEIIRNQISVWAIDGAKETLIFFGNILTAWGNYQQMPDAFLEVQAKAGLFAQLQPVPPSSYPGAADVATLMGQLAQGLGLTFENNGVTGVQLSNPCLQGTLLEQVQELANAANIDLYIDNQVLAITPRNTPRATQGNLVPQVSSATGLVGYPSFSSGLFGINFQTLFNSAILFGGLVQVTTSIQAALNQVPNLQRADGLWIVNSVSHHLQSETPGGAWFSTVSASKQRVVTS